MTSNAASTGEEDPLARSRVRGLRKVVWTFNHDSLRATGEPRHPPPAAAWASSPGEVYTRSEWENAVPGDPRRDEPARLRNDAYIEPVKFPAGLGYEAAGIVDAVGKDVTGFAAGDEVNLVPSFSMNQYFTYGEVILAPDYAVVKHPKSLSFTEAASIWMMFVTAYGALIEDAKVTTGD